MKHSPINVSINKAQSILKTNCLKIIPQNGYGMKVNTITATRESRKARLQTHVRLTFGYKYFNDGSSWSKFLTYTGWRPAQSS
jgi:hypothetical protein